MKNNCEMEGVYLFYIERQKKIKDKYVLAELIKEEFPMLTVSSIVRATGWTSYTYYIRPKIKNKSDKSEEDVACQVKVKKTLAQKNLLKEINEFQIKVKKRLTRKDLLININKLSIFYLNKKEITDDKFVLAKLIEKKFPMLSSNSIIRATGWRQYRFYLKTKEERLQIKIAQKCFRKKADTRRKDLILNIKNEFGGKCCSCGYNKCFAALDFHHLDPNDKEINISQCYKEEDMRREAAKCILLCSNCHREEHERLRNI